MLIRTGKRWVTLTQLPVAFSGDNNEKTAPEPAPKTFDSTGQSEIGIHIDADHRLEAGADVVQIGFLKLASTHQC